MSTLMEIKTKEPLNADAHLAHLARTDAEAFAELYRRHVTSVYRYHMAHTGNVNDAEDLTSQTFMAALEGIRSYRGTGSFPGSDPHDPGCKRTRPAIGTDAFQRGHESL